MSNAQKPKVLIVEDDRNNHDLFRQAYEGAGFDVVVCVTAEGPFVDEVAHFMPDVISMDLMIGQPGMEVKRDGFDAIELLKADERTKDIPIIVASNFYVEEKIKHAKELGAVDYYNLQGQPITRIAERFHTYATAPHLYKPSHPLFRE